MKTIDHVGTHLAHCFQGEYEDSCCYGDPEDCPARDVPRIREYRPFVQTVKAVQFREDNFDLLVQEFGFQIISKDEDPTGNECYRFKIERPVVMYGVIYHTDYIIIHLDNSVRTLSEKVFLENFRRHYDW